MNLLVIVILILFGLFLEEKKERKYLVGLYRYVFNEKGGMIKFKFEFRIF